MVPEKQLEELWAWGLQNNQNNSIQTNATLINDNHMRLFKKYRVHVGISVDGPGELNDVRWAGSLERTREATARTHQAIERLCQEGMPASLIVTLHRGNATQDKLPAMHDWFRYLQGIGLTTARLHILETESQAIRDKYALSTQENIDAFLSFLALEKELATLNFDVFEDMRNLLLGQDNNATCIWSPHPQSSSSCFSGTMSGSPPNRVNAPPACSTPRFIFSISYAWRILPASRWGFW